MIGPLVVAAVLLSDEGADRLEGLNVRDSKTYKDAKTVVNRFFEIGSIVDRFTVRLIPSAELNEKNAQKITMDRLMIPQIVDMVVELADGLNEKPKVLVDNLQHKEELQQLLEDRGFEVTIEPEAEQYLPVAAASVVASAQFEMALRKLRMEYGELGSGNPNDPKTITFLKAWWKKHKSWPEFVRTYYKTIKRLQGE